MGSPPVWSLTATYSKDTAGGTAGPAIVVPTYKGKRQADAVAWFKADAADLFREEDVGRAGRAGRARCRER